MRFLQSILALLVLVLVHLKDQAMVLGTCICTCPSPPTCPQNPTLSPTASPTRSRTSTRTSSRSITSSPSRTQSVSGTRSASLSRSRTQSRSRSSSKSRSNSPSHSSSKSLTPTVSFSRSPSRSLTRSVSRSPCVGSLTGLVFFDVNANGQFDGTDVGIPGVQILLSDGQIDTTDTLPAGRFNGFTPLMESLGPLQLSVPSMQDALDGLIPTTPLSVTVQPCTPVVIYFGFRLDLPFIDGQLANGFTQGFWKTNLDKALSGTTMGVQVSASQLQIYLNTLSSFLLSPLNVATFQQALDVFNGVPSGALNVAKAKALLSVQLLASEFNFLNGAFIGGDALFTRLFLLYGEHLLLHSSDVSLILQAKDAYEAYNSSHGGAIQFP